MGETMTGDRFRFPKVEFGPEERALREEIREFIRAERASGGFTPMADSWGSGWSPEWSRKMGETRTEQRPDEAPFANAWAELS